MPNIGVTGGAAAAAAEAEGFPALSELPSRVDADKTPVRSPPYASGEALKNWG